MLYMRTTLALLGTFGALFMHAATSAPLSGQEPTTPDDDSHPCRSDPVAREFDFWIGEWAVFNDGRRAGTNRVELILEGCVLLENWTNAGGRQGKSFNWVDRSTYPEPRWRQLWVDDAGNTLDYAEGAFRDGAMRFEGRTVTEEGDTILQTMRFVPVHADTVRQIMQQSDDGGASWQTTWNGLYVRISSEGAPGGRLR